MFCAGDLIRLPSHVGLYQLNEYNTVDYFIKTMKPKVGIFIDYENKHECIVNVDGQNWLVEVQSIRIMEKKND